MTFFIRLNLTKRRFVSAICWVALTGVVIHFNACSGGFSASVDDLPSSLQSNFAVGQSLFKTNCSGCHTDTKFFTDRRLSPDRMEELIYFAFEKVPQMGGLQSRLSSQDIRSIAESLSNSAVSKTCTMEDGRVTAQRLNRREYENTLRDLTGLPISVASRFPEDPVTIGFDNNAASLTMTPTTGETYLQVAEDVATELFAKNRARIVSCTPTTANFVDCAKASLASFGKLAFRRPLKGAENELYFKIFNTVKTASPNTALIASFDDGMKAVVTALLISPQFLYRTITISDNKNPQAVESLDAYELASRLSYFLWSTMPDGALLDLAASGQLLQENILDEQIMRMLKDPKARSLIMGFGAHWVHLNQLKSRTPSSVVFPQFNESLRLSMQQETELFIEEILLKDRSLYDFLEADFTFVDQRLASLYGISGVNSDAFQRVSLSGTPRQGVITHGSILTVTANPSESNIVRRGLFVLENILCSQPPPPPPGVDITLKPGEPSQTPRQRMEAHRSDPNCMSCHSVMDPIGYSLENFNGIGQWRNTYSNQLPIDASGKLPDGSSFQNSTEMISILRRSEGYPACATEKLMTYAIGRAVMDSEKCKMEEMGRLAVRRDTKFSDLVKAIIKSSQFRTQKGDQP